MKPDRKPSAPAAVVAAGVMAVVAVVGATAETAAVVGEAGAVIAVIVETAETAGNPSPPPFHLSCSVFPANRPCARSTCSPWGNLLESRVWLRQMFRPPSPSKFTGC